MTPRRASGPAPLDELEASLPEIARTVVARAQAREPAADAWPPVEALPALEADVADLVRGILARISGAQGGSVVRRPLAPAFDAHAGLPAASTRLILRSAAEVVSSHLERDCAASTGGSASDERSPSAQRIAAVLFSTLEDVLALADESEDDRESPVVATIRRVLAGEVDGVAEALARVGVSDFSPPFLVVAVTTESGRRSEVEPAARQYAARLALPSLPVCFCTGPRGYPGFAVLVIPRTTAQVTDSEGVARLDAAARAGDVSVMVAHMDDPEELSGALDDLRSMTGLARVAAGRAHGRRVLTVKDLLSWDAAATMGRSRQERLLELALAPLMTGSAKRATEDLELLRVKCERPRATQEEIAMLLNSTRSAVKHQVARIQAQTGLVLADDLATVTLAVNVYDLLADVLPPPGNPRWGRRPLLAPEPATAGGDVPPDG